MPFEPLLYRLTIDHRQFTQGNLESRAALEKTRKSLTQTRAPARRLQTRIDALGREMENSIPSISAYGSSIRSLATPVGAIGAGAAAAATAFFTLKSAVLGTASAINREFTEIDRLSKAAQTLGFADANSLKVLEIAADKVGISFEQLETTIRTMNKNLGDAALGTGEATGALTSLRIDVQRLLGLAPEKQFQLIAKRISQIPDVLRQTSIAMKIFGETGSASLRLLGTDFAAVREEAERTRQLLTGPERDAIQSFNDDVATLTRSIGGLARELGRDLVPQMTTIVQTLSQALALLPSITDQLKVLARIVRIAGRGVLPFGRTIDIALGAGQQGLNIATRQRLENERTRANQAPAALDSGLPGSEGPPRFNSLRDLIQEVRAVGAEIREQTVVIENPTPIAFEEIKATDF